MNISKPLYLLDKNERYYFIYFDRLTSNPTYISTMNLITDLEDEMKESQNYNTITIYTTCFFYLFCLYIFFIR